MENNHEKILFDDGTHKCVMFSFDDESQEERFLSVNQYLIIQNDSAILLDPGSSAIFYDLSEAIERHIAIDKLRYIFFSHQDPDVAGSITEWGVATKAKLVLSKLWVRFMSHYGLLDMGRMLPLEDHGGKIVFGNDALHFIPAHFLHSPGNFSLYDSRSQILFSGDIGAAVVPPSQLYKEVHDFESHLPYLEGFHRRYMASNAAVRFWVQKVRRFDIAQIAPQHGALLKDQDVTHFLAWFEQLRCGIDLGTELYG
ncbi:MAG: MBL fold metallo-hydrolase [Campylobacterales bacterium]|nr:MBL fold metallo-hydrolase [Campylobacterales bacterium]